MTPLAHSSAETPEWLNLLSHRVIECAISVHRSLGPGLAERLYEEAMMIELVAAGLRPERQVPVTLMYRGVPLPIQRLDLVVDSAIVVELKAVEAVLDLHLAQMLSYLRAADLPLGLLINVNAVRLTDGVRRRINAPALARFREPPPIDIPPPRPDPHP